MGFSLGGGLKMPGLEMPSRNTRSYGAVDKPAGMSDEQWAYLQRLIKGNGKLDNAGTKNLDVGGSGSKENKVYAGVDGKNTTANLASLASQGETGLTKAFTANAYLPGAHGTGQIVANNPMFGNLVSGAVGSFSDPVRGSNPQNASINRPMNHGSSRSSISGKGMEAVQAAKRKQEMRFENDRRRNEGFEDLDRELALRDKYERMAEERRLGRIRSLLSSSGGSREGYKEALFNNAGAPTPVKLKYSEPVSIESLLRFL